MSLVKKHFLLMTMIVFIVVTTILSILYFTLPVYYKVLKMGEMESTFNTIVTQLNGNTREQIVNSISQYDEATNRINLSLKDSNGSTIYPMYTIDSNEDFRVYIYPLLDSSGESVSTQTLHSTILTSTGTKFQLIGRYSLQPISETSHVLLTLYPFLLIISLLIAGIISYIFSRISTRRIIGISKITRQMKTLEQDLSCQIEGGDEIADLAKDINSLYSTLLMTINQLQGEIEKVAELEREKSEFLRVTSHELKTPISNLQGIIDGMIYNVGDFKDRDKYLLKCQDILDEQRELVQSILSLSKLEIPAEHEEELISIKTLLENKLEMYYVLAKVRQYHFKVSMDEDITIKGNAMFLLKAIKNILDNAFRYTKSNGNIVLLLHKGELIIKNQAEHLLNETQILNIFNPFYRPDYSRNRKDGGTGLGLFIVKQILDKHNISYSFKRIGDYMEFVIHFYEDPQKEQ
ncbi:MULTISPECIES: HAMP domain-containing sensor histidine kinase [unclassified Granulicatella]|uniref:HAMP domain-containing sensor histidine kinase n=1 Tax=unclassified Granulicatella TaxID=2630493 RepID=UPI0010734483|nr:HAMP domain-containing sensor histidine kinase [Granulicatella sp. WM01]MBF0779729.1 HAMP domain-containing histidine kinase [Granulicatella sp. 19428wC4_WM01]TFU96273.1 HAMP domain-containing histidine kinase [Granulicatella sp. WM01]